MSQLILEFPLGPGAVTLDRGLLLVELGNGVRLTTSAPKWVTNVTEAKLTLTMEVDGSPTDAPLGPAPIE